MTATSTRTARRLVALAAVAAVSAVAGCTDEQASPTSAALTQQGSGGAPTSSAPSTPSSPSAARSADSSSSAASSTTAASGSTRLENPLDWIKSDPELIGEVGRTLLSAKGKGRQTYRLPAVRADTRIGIAVSCTPRSPYEITSLGKLKVAAHCAVTSGANATAPASNLPSRSITINVPKDTQFWLVLAEVSKPADGNAG